jgi:hypothetical protein
MPNPDAQPHQSTVAARLAAQTATTVVPGTVIGDCPEDATVSGVVYTPDAAATGATATKRTYTLVNRGQDGTGSTVIATFDGITGANLVAGDDKAFTLSGTAANLNVSAGDVLAIAEAVTSTGTANPGGEITVTLARR